MKESDSPSTTRCSTCPINHLLFGAGARTAFGDLGLALARAGIGLYMAFGHGYGKLFGGDGFGPSEGFVSGVEELGFPAPLVFAWMAALSEFLGGLALAAGLFTRPAALTLVGTMAVAAFLQHGDDPWTSRGGASKEMAMLYLLPCLGFLALGGGRFSVDSGLRRVLFCKR